MNQQFRTVSVDMTFKRQQWYQEGREQYRASSPADFALLKAGGWIKAGTVRFSPKKEQEPIQLYLTLCPNCKEPVKDYVHGIKGYFTCYCCNTNFDANPLGGLYRTFLTAKYFVRMGLVRLRLHFSKA